MEEQIVTQMVAADGGAHWSVLVGLVLMCLVWVFQTTTRQRIPAASVPMINAVIGVLVGIAQLLTTGRPWYEALASGLLVGAAAGGFWGMLGKHVLPAPRLRKPKKPVETVPKE